MPVTRVTVTEEIGEGRSATVDRSEVADTIRPWFPEAPPEVVAAIDDLQVRLNRHEYLDGLDEYLALRVETAREDGDVR